MIINKKVIFIRIKRNYIIIRYYVIHIFRQFNNFNMNTLHNYGTI